MPGRQFNALRSRFGLSAVAPIVFSPTPQGKVWGGLSCAGELGNAGVAMEPLEGELLLQPDEATAAFVDWLSAAYPGLVEAVTDALTAGVAEPAGLSAVQEGGLLTRILDVAQTVLPAYLQFEQQREVLDIQLERARAGLPPLSTEQFAPSVQVGLDRDTIARLADEAAARAASGAGALFSSPWFWGAVALAGGAFVYSMTRRRRRR